MDTQNEGIHPAGPQNSGELRIRSSPNVKVRTMESDIQAIGRTGGNISNFGGGTPVMPSVPATSFPRAGIPSPAPQSLGRDLLIRFLGSRIVLAFGFIGTLVVLGLLGYFIVYPSVFRSNPLPPHKTIPPPPVTTNPPPKTLFVHESFFRLPADATLEFRFSSGPISNAADLQTFGQKLSGLVDQAGALGSLFEIRMEESDGTPLAFTDFLSRIHATIFSKAFLEENFNRDFTAFVYREKNNLWPGYVLRLKPGLTQLVLQDEVRKIENSADVVRFFLDEPSEPRADTFSEKQIGTRPMRYLTFGNSGVAFAYSWFNSENLVLSTSEAGLQRAFDFLGR